MADRELPPLVNCGELDGKPFLTASSRFTFKMRPADVAARVTQAAADTLVGYALPLDFGYFGSCQVAVVFAEVAEDGTRVLVTCEVLDADSGLGP